MPESHGMPMMLIVSLPSVFVAGLLALLFGAVACGGNAASDSPRTRARVIDEEQGAYRGVRLGGVPGDVHEVFGPKDAAGENEPATPLKGEAYGATSITYPDGPCPSPFFRYDYVAFGFNCGKLLWIETTELGAETLRSVAVGDPLAGVEEAYPEAVCGKVGGGEYEEYPACSARLGKGRFIWFGGDPITTIELGVVPLDGVAEEKPFTGQVFTLEDGEFVTYPPGEAKPGDKIVCVVEGKRIEEFVPPPNTGVSTDPMYVATKPDGRVRAECGGIHAETAPPGSW